VAAYWGVEQKPNTHRPYEMKTSLVAAHLQKTTIGTQHSPGGMVRRKFRTFFKMSIKMGACKNKIKNSLWVTLGDGLLPRLLQWEQGLAGVAETVGRGQGAGRATAAMGEGRGGEGRGCMGNKWV